MSNMYQGAQLSRHMGDIGIKKKLGRMGSLAPPVAHCCTPPCLSMKIMQMLKYDFFFLGNFEKCFFKMRNNFHSSRRKKMCLVVKVPYAKKPQVSLCYYLHESSFSHMVNFEIRSPSSSTTSILRAGEGRIVSRLKNVKQFVHFGKLHTIIPRKVV